MRDYGVVRVRFWEWAKRKGLNAEERELALYLLTSPHCNSLGCFRLPMAYLCDDLGKGLETVSQTVLRLSEIGFMERDEPSGWTWIVGYLEHNPVPNRNVGKAIEKQIDAVPMEASFYAQMVEALRSIASANDKGISGDFLDRVSERYRNRIDRVPERVYGSETGLKTHTQTQTHEHTHEQEHKTADLSAKHDSQVLAAFNAWNEAAACHPRWPKAQNLSPVRHRTLKARIDDAGDLDAFVAVLGKAEASRFICDEMKGWSLDWFLKASNFTKVREGNYDGPVNGASSRSRDSWAESLP